MNGLAPTYLCDLFHTRMEVNIRVTRNNQALHIPFCYILIVKVLFFMSFIGGFLFMWFIASAREGDNALFTGEKQKKTRAPSGEHATFRQAKTANAL